MFGKKFLFCIGASLAVLLLAYGSASAAPLLPGINEQEDEDSESLLFKLASDGAPFTTPGTVELVEVDDLIGGVIKIQKTQTVYPVTSPEVDLQAAPDTFTAIFLIKVLTTGNATIDGNSETLTFGAPTALEWVSAFGAGGPLDVSSVFDVSIAAAGTAAFYFDGVDYDDAVIVPPGATSASAAATSFISGGTLLWEFGFTGAAGEFWSTIGIDADVTALTTTNSITNRFALNVTAYHAGPELIAHNWLGALTGPPDTNFTMASQLQGKGSFQSNPTGTQFGLQTDTNLYLQPDVPEPSSLVIFSLLTVIGGAASCVRRRKRPAQA